MILRPPRTKRTVNLFPYNTHIRSSPSPACGRRWREAPDEGASAASCSCSCIQQRQTSKAALRFARAPSSALRAPSPVKREKGCISNPPLRFKIGRASVWARGCQAVLCFVVDVLLQKNKRKHSQK